MIYEHSSPPPPLPDVEWTAYMNLCHIADYRGDFGLALQYAEKACCIKPDPDAFFHIGIVLGHMGRFKDAIEIYRRASIQAPEKSIYKYNLAFALLSDKQLSEGFNLYDLRLTVDDEPNFSARASQIRNQFMGRFHRLWDGKEFYRHIYVFAEQGIGDAIYFIRYLPFLVEDAEVKNAKITFEVQRSLAPVIKYLFPKINVVPRDGEVFPVPKHYDTAFSICSLGKLYWNKSIKIPYFHSDDPISIPQGRLKVGLCWAGYPGFPNDHLRSLKLSEFKRLPSEGIDYYSFQMGIMKRNWIHGETVDLLDCEFPFAVDATQEIFDFRDTMRLVNNMDLIISADTSLAHLAGAMGKKVWLLNPLISDWRWCQDMNNDDGYNCWYPSMRVFTQERYRDWGGVLDRVAKELYALI